MDDWAWINSGMLWSEVFILFIQHTEAGTKYHYFADDIFTSIFLKENICILPFNVNEFCFYG